jgi:hypothetical protein
MVEVKTSGEVGLIGKPRKAAGASRCSSSSDLALGYW